MADQDKDKVTLNASSLTYRCSVCKVVWPGYYNVQIHIQKTDTCRDNGATVEVIAKSEDIQQAVEKKESEPEVVTPVVSVFAQTQSFPIKQPKSAPVQSSMAERALSALTPSWAESPDSEDEAEDEGIRQLPISITASRPYSNMLMAVYDTYLASGYVGSIGQWAEEIITHWHVLMGVNIELMSFKPQDRELELAKAGLTNAR